MVSSSIASGVIGRVRSSGVATSQSDVEGDSPPPYNRSKQLANSGQNAHGIASIGASYWNELHSVHANVALTLSCCCNVTGASQIAAAPLAHQREEQRSLW